MKDIKNKLDDEWVAAAKSKTGNLSLGKRLKLCFFPGYSIYRTHKIAKLRKKLGIYSEAEYRDFLSNSSFENSVLEAFKAHAYYQLVKYVINLF